MKTTDQYRLPVERGIRVELGWHKRAIPTDPGLRSQPEFLHRDNLPGLVKSLTALADDLRSSASEGKPPVLLGVDLFAGAGGLSLGLQDAGIQVIAAVDNDPDAVATHRAWFPGLALDWDLHDSENCEALAVLMKAAEIEVLVGGPPCQPFSRAGRSLMRSLVDRGVRDEHDPRKDLWQRFLDIVGDALPEAVLMENVPGMALDGEMLILRTMTDELETLGYTVSSRILTSRDYGVPQVRQRLFLVAVRTSGPKRSGRRFQWPPHREHPVNVHEAIGDLYRCQVEPGWNSQNGGGNTCEYPGPLPSTGKMKSFSEEMREGIRGAEKSVIHDHITRAVRADDLKVFEEMDPETKYSELPALAERLSEEDDPDSDKLKPRYKTGTFTDKYKKLDENGPSRAITAHLARDGYWYIHPHQPRTLTIREAARIQTFPDRFRFNGTPTAILTQIGNAVPPRLARALGESIAATLGSSRRTASGSRTGSVVPTQRIADLLAEWVSAGHRAARPSGTDPPAHGIPWATEPVELILALDPAAERFDERRRTTLRRSRWKVLLGEFLLGRDSNPVRANEHWTVVEREFGKLPSGDEDHDVMETVIRSACVHMQGPKRERSARDVKTWSHSVAGNPGLLDSRDSLSQLDGVDAALLNRVFQLTPYTGDDQIVVSAGALRVAARLLGPEDPVVDDTGGGRPAWARVKISGHRTAGRIAISRIVGINPLPTGKGGSAAEPADHEVGRRRGQLAKIGLLGLARTHCVIERPRCGSCPLREVCASSQPEA